MWLRLCTGLRYNSHVGPLHELMIGWQRWNGNYFECITLKSLGLRIQLGHPPGDTCYNRKPASSNNFIVIDANGVHMISLDFCGCESAQTNYKQLLWCWWFPATTTDPRMAATFSVLKSFHLLSLESKAFVYEYYSSLARLMDNTGFKEVCDQYSLFLCITRQFHHLKQLKWAGRGHDPNGIEATKSGECVVKCPACPHPGVNLLDGWEAKAPAQGWMYVLFVAIDANFHLKRKAVLSNEVNPSLNRRWAYFVEEDTYKSYLARHAKEPQEVSHILTFVFSSFITDTVQTEKHLCEPQCREQHWYEAFMQAGSHWGRNSRLCLTWNEAPKRCGRSSNWREVSKHSFCIVKLKI